MERCTKLAGMLRPDEKSEQSESESLPEWFHGLMSRREADDLLKNQETGRFLIRLSQRTFGYILSYKGKERCRHYIINQLKNGRLVVSGDCCSHNSLPALISHYQNSPIDPYGEKLTETFIKFSDYNKYDEISSINEDKNSLRNANSLPQKKMPDTPLKNKREGNAQEKRTGSRGEDTAPPLPERSSNLLEDAEDDDDEVYSKPRKCLVGSPSNASGLTVPAKQQEHKSKEGVYSQCQKTDVVYSLAKEAQVNRKNMLKNNIPQVVYSEVMLDKSLPFALGHLQSSSHSSSTSQEAQRVDTKVKEVSQYKVLEMKFASSLQCTDMVNTFRNAALNGPLLHGRVEMAAGSSMHSATVSQSDLGSTYEQIPFKRLNAMGDCHSMDQISNISISCKTTTQTSKEVISENLYERVPLQSTLEDNTYEMVTRGFTEPTVKKQNVIRKGTQMPSRVPLAVQARVSSGLLQK
ncbi:SH2 domain-containing protein 7 [Spea bombifrons]|uniref:SH2 domain-containing protein 7 n=1 Tax=Spea bombifrons TaxID=233779 RepID=UPI00234B5EA0|nr:SH2 domain-containing protein 7 [Spea bombifrons]